MALKCQTSSFTSDERRATSDERRATSDERRATSDERRVLPESALQHIIFIRKIGATGNTCAGLPHSHRQESPAAAGVICDTCAVVSYASYYST